MDIRGVVRIVVSHCAADGMSVHPGILSRGGTLEEGMEKPELETKN